VQNGDGREKTVCKVRGKTFNYIVINMLNLEVFRDMILRGNNGDEPSVVNVHTENEIKRKRNRAEEDLLITKPMINNIQSHL